MPTLERNLTGKVRQWIMMQASNGLVQTRDVTHHFDVELKPVKNRSQFVSAIIGELVKKTLLVAVDNEPGEHGRLTYTATDLGKATDFDGSIVRPRKWDAKPLCAAFGLARDAPLRPLIAVSK